ncbi:YjbE family integral membrane protein [Desulfohalotomaculum tongense]|uniref:TerC family protein n=1 Tax=Desulforadius tongensis TaxID=1216062 RepID=UPI00195D4E2F|nr:TerC family protein [Desulforadius tongensis]MBM7854590.1 YjbE family integral membrane protein [Desulforadius tongensis]
MELFSADFWVSLLLIIGIDLVLAGDNAIVIGMAVRNLPLQHQNKAIIYGTLGAVVIRVIATLLVVELLKIPYLLLAGGLVLIWIAYQLLAEDEHHDVEAAKSLAGAIKTIIIADAAMGLDNVLAVAGAAHGSFLLVILGLLISIPIVIWGSTVISRLMNKYPVIIYFGAGILALTAGKMITGEPVYREIFKTYPLLKWGLIAIIVTGVLVMGRKAKKRSCGRR